jgi:Ca2+-binding EF-hand superfamily protein
MRTALLLAAALTAGLIGTAQAQESSDPLRAPARNLVTACDTDKDGMVSKQEFMKQMEKMFDNMDSKKAGKLDSKQIEKLLAQLMKTGGA